MPLLRRVVWLVLSAVGSFWLFHWTIPSSSQTSTPVVPEHVPIEKPEQPFAVIAPVDNGVLIAPDSFLSSSTVVIDAVLYDGYELNHLDEAIRLRSVAESGIDIGGWRLNDGELSSSTFPSGTILGPGQAIWLAKSAEAFLRQFGHLPDFEQADSPYLNVADLIGGWPQLNDNGDQVILYDRGNHIVDCLVYEEATTHICANSWNGGAVWPYQVGSLFASEGQILYRRRDPTTGLLVPDTDAASDWAQATGDVLDGRKLLYPGWDLERFFFTTQVTSTGVVTVAIAPDNSYQAVHSAIAAADTSIQIESMTIENLAIGDALAEAAIRGVSVTLLLEGGPPSGIEDAERQICRQLELAGGQCWFMINDPALNIHDRYRLLHAKFILIDGERLIVSSENLSPHSMPYDDKRDGTWGRRGVLLIIEAPAIVQHAQTIFDLDLDSAHHRDVLRWNAAHPTYGEPSAGYIPVTTTGGVTYSVRYSRAAAFSGTFQFEITQSPENSLHGSRGLLGLIGLAGSGDTILIEQLSERPHWGPGDSNPWDDPNPRLEAYLDAARRGAQVRLLLDSFFDDQDSLASNRATCAYVTRVSMLEGLAVECALANPTGQGIHSKIVLASISGRGVVHVGSINGTESSHKVNRELAIQIHSDDAYALLADMFYRDWPVTVFLPAAFVDYVPPAGHLLISEFLYDPAGVDDEEFIELVNPTDESVDLGGFSLGDAVGRSDFEDVRRFPAGTIVGAGETIVVATTATAFRETYGSPPDFEILATDPSVPDLRDDSSWGDPAAWLQLGNGGDEVILRDREDRVVDVVTYGSGRYPGTVPCDLVTFAGASLERVPHWRDTNNCPKDFREWPFPSPGALPR
jgi:phosphatidylserine/phosphatidylglycerophosphate/cardiolipin synthase-like enzyme